MTKYIFFMILLLFASMPHAGNVDFPSSYEKIQKHNPILRLDISNASVLKEDNLTHMYMRYSLLNITNDRAPRTFRNRYTAAGIPLFLQRFGIYRITNILTLPGKIKVTYSDNPYGNAPFFLNRHASDFVLFKTPTMTYNCAAFFNPDTNETILPFPKSRCA